MKHLKNIIFIFVILTLLLTACSQGDIEADVPSGKTESPPGEAEAPSAEGTMPLQVYVDTYGEDAGWVTESQVTTYIEEEFNIDFDIIAGEEGKLPLLLASGEYPPVIYRGELGAAEVWDNAEIGIFIPLDDLIEEHAPNIKAAFEEVPGLREMWTAPDGHIYSLGYYDECFHCLFRHKYWINQAWLDKLGLDMPTTTEEFEQVLIAFRDQDPNGNGAADEVPLTGNAGGDPTEDPINFLMNAFIYNTGHELGGASVKDYVYFDGDELKFAPIQPEWKKGVEYIKGLYDQGLLDPLAFTQDHDQFRALCNDEDVQKCGVFPAFHLGAGVDPWINLDRANEYEALPPLKGPDGVQYALHTPSGNTGGTFLITNKATEEEAIKAIQLADWHFSFEGTLTSWGGPGGWAYSEEGALGLNGEPAVWKLVEHEGAEQLGSMTWEPMTFVPARIFQSWEQSQDPKTLDGYELRLQQATYLYEPFGPERDPFTNGYLSAEDNDIFTRLALPILDNAYLNTVAFITGEKDIATEWDAYVASFEDLQLEEYMNMLKKYNE